MNALHFTPTHQRLSDGMLLEQTGTKVIAGVEHVVAIEADGCMYLIPARELARIEPQLVGYTPDELDSLTRMSVKGLNLILAALSANPDAAPHPATTAMREQVLNERSTR